VAKVMFVVDPSLQVNPFQFTPNSLIFYRLFPHSNFSP
jgi:hypothetical protein